MRAVQQLKTNVRKILNPTPAGVAAQGQGDVQEDDKVANSKDGQVLGRGAVDLILQGTLWTHTRPDPLTQELSQRAPCM